MRDCKLIHYHGTPFSGGNHSHTALAGKHAFVSFARKSHMAMVAELSQSFALDNGAFSAWKSGSDFDIAGYAKWVETWYRHPGHDFYIMPDVIDGDHDDNAKMRSAWFKLCSGDMWHRGYPVWHLHEPLEVLEGFVKDFRGIALGSSGKFATIGTADWWDRMHEAMKVMCDESGCPIKPIHGLRMLDPTIFSHLPFKSADSTNAARNCGLDRWSGPYEPVTKKEKALVIMGRIESHASASRYTNSKGVEKNLDLFG